MARPSIPDKTRIVIAGNAQIAAYLDSLAKTGLYGVTRAEVAKTLVTEMIKRLIDEEFLAKVAESPHLKAQRTQKKPTGREGGRVRGGQR
jgi:hypothetical protein